MIFGSNLIERASSGLDMTLKLYHVLLCREHILDNIKEHNPEYKELERELLWKDLPTNMKSIIQHHLKII